MTVQLLHGDCLEILPTLPDNSVDSIVTDPPYGLSFMGKDWDHGVPGEHFWREALRVAKPGAHLLAFGGTRTFHRLAVAIEDAGWEIRDCLMWVYGSGFPKSLDVSKAIDKAQGVEPSGYTANPAERPGNGEGATTSTGWVKPSRPPKPIATGDAARQWQGWGTALKPAWEPIIVARKPLSESTVAANVLKWGTGAINVDGCRVDAPEGITSGGNYTDKHAENANGEWGMKAQGRATPHTQGRWPANLIHDGSQMVMDLFPQSSTTGNRRVKDRVQQEAASTPFNRGQDAPEYTDSGSAARFFYCAKASKADRDEGCEGLQEREAGIKNDSGRGFSETDPMAKIMRRNHHPTVKPTALMRYLCRLVTPPGGVILDPFMGSGSTGKAAVKEGFGFIGMDKEFEYVNISKARII